MKEYIIPIDDTAIDWDEMFVGVIRKQEELIRCKDCKKRKQCKVATEYYYCDMTGAIVGVSEFCSWAERKDDETD